jgi:predicted anti-sigma-YlaC factor YlaD
LKRGDKEMKCRQVQKKLSVYLDDELDTNFKKLIESHLEECNTCQIKLKTIQETWDLLNEIPEPEPVQYFYTRLKARMSSKVYTKRAGRLERFLLPASIGAAVYLGILIGSIVGQNGKGLNTASNTEAEIVSSLYLDNFNDFPSASFGEAYFSFTSLK